MSDGEGDRLSRRAMLLGRFLGRPGSAAERPETGADATPAPSATGRVHRPPGAVDEPRFLAECTRCGDCMTACPVDAIIPAPERHGAAAGFPMIDATSAPCVMCADMPCIPACEPGVLSADAPVRMGVASIRTAYCLAHAGTICTVCSERCPVEDVIEVQAGKPVIDASTCTGCGVCQYVCPAPYNAVLILPAERGGAPDDGANDGANDAVNDAGSSATPSHDWRKAYFGDRSLRPPGEG